MRIKPSYTEHDLNCSKINFKCKQVKNIATFRQLLDTYIGSFLVIHRQTCG